MMEVVQTIQNVGSTKHPKGSKSAINYGTAGFRTKAENLDHVMYRMGVLAAIRSRVKNSKIIGAMITASHNPAQDNGVKLVDPAGEMLENKWESVATAVANASDEELGVEICAVLQKFKVDMDEKALVYVGRDTRPSSEGLAQAVLDGIKAAGGEAKDFGVVTTPQLHYFVVCENTNHAYGQPTMEGYFNKLAGAFESFRGKIKQRGDYNNEFYFDGANGVGAIAMQGLVSTINASEGDLLKVDIFNGNVDQHELLNHQCGADFVKVQQRVPENFPVVKLHRCVSVDGDADRVIYFYTDTSDKFQMLDGDRIATLIAGYLKELLANSGLELNLGLVQTAYANGSSTDYIAQKLDIPVACVPTGVKHLHHKALDFEIGVYFEANGHGTVVYSEKAQKAIIEAADNDSDNEHATKLKLFMDMTNQCVGDALSDMLLVESVLFAKGWNVQDWNHAYQDLPNRQIKVEVADRNVIETTDAERKCSKPAGLQAEIDSIVSKYPKGRSFVRPSGTEDVVRVYAEAETQEHADKLASEVGAAVKKLAGGV